MGYQHLHKAVAIAHQTYSSLLNLVSVAELILFLAAALDLVGDELLVLLERALDVQLEAHNVVEHALNLRVEFLAQGVGAELKLFVP